jgi:hypothetical protein
MRDARVEEVEHVSDSDSEERDEPQSQSQARLTVAIYPENQGPTYLILNGKQERDNWLYHLTVVSGGGPNSGTQYEQLIQKLMEIDGDPSELDRRRVLIGKGELIVFFIPRLCSMASSGVATHKGKHFVTIHFITFRNITNRSNQTIQSEFLKRCLKVGNC